MSSHQPKHPDLAIDPALQGAVDHGKLPLDVEHAAEARAAGRRLPSDEREAAQLLALRIDGLRARYLHLIDRRLAGVHTFEREQAKRDPPKLRPLWQTLLINVATTALTSATGGLAAAFVKQQVGSRVTGAMKDALAGFAAAEVSQVETTIINHQLAPSPSPRDAPHDQGKAAPPLHADVAFIGLQEQVLQQLRLDTADQGIAEVGLAAMRAERTKPGSGLAAIDAIAAELAKQAAVAEVKQHQATAMAWNVFLAQNDRHGGVTAKGGTDLSRQIEMGSEDGSRFDHKPGSGLPWQFDHVAGLLRLELAGKRGTDRVHIKSAHLSGQPTSAARNAIHGIPLKLLKMPIVAELVSGPVLLDKRGFAIGRNEVGEYFVKDHDSKQMDDLSDAERRELAKRIFEHDLANATVDVKS